MSQAPSSGASTGKTPAPPRPQDGSARLVIIGLAAGLTAAILVNVYIQIDRKRRTVDRFVIYRMTRTLEPNDKITARDIEPVEIPEEFNQTFVNAVRRAPNGESERLGEVLKQGIDMGEILEYRHFTDDPKDKLVSEIRKGYRLVALPVDRNILPSVRPGMKVDIEAPFGSGGPAPQVLTLMENVRVMAVGQRSVIEENDSGASAQRISGFKTISIQVLPQQATQLSRIQKIAAGPFELHIRSDKDENTPKIPGGGINPEVLKKIGEDVGTFGDSS